MLYLRLTGFSGVLYEVRTEATYVCLSACELLPASIPSWALFGFPDISAFVCSEIHTKHINTLCGQNVELLNVKLAVHIVTTVLQRVKYLV